MDQKVAEIVKHYENDFFMAYKDQMHEIQKELKSMKKKIDEETLKQKADEKKRILEEERDYFRQEALRLDKMCNEQLRTIEELRFKLKITNEEKNYYEGFVIDSKKENKALKYELLQLYKQKMDRQHQNQRKNYQEQSEIPQRPWTQDQNLMEFIETGEKQQQSMKPQTSGEMFSTQVEFSKLRGLSSQQKSRVPRMEINGEIERLRQLNEENEQAIGLLRSELEKEKRQNKRMKIDASQTNSVRSELEYILLDCVNEIKKEIFKRRLQQKQQLQNKPLTEILAEQDIDYTKFSKADKKKLLKLFIMSDQFLDTIYQITFNPTQVQSSQVKLNEQWKKEANEVNKQYRNFRNYKFYNITSQPSVKSVITKRDLASTFNDFTDKTRGLIQKVKSPQQ